MLCHTFQKAAEGLTLSLTAIERIPIKGGTRTNRKHGKDKGIKRNVVSREQKIGKWDRFIILDENNERLATFYAEHFLEHSVEIQGKCVSVEWRLP